MSENLEQRADELYESPLSRGIRPFPDLIPGVGMVTYLDRIRRQIEESIVDFYIRGIGGGIFNPKNIISLGMRNWPKPTTERHKIRSGLHQLVSVGFTLYHVGIPYGIYRAVEHFF